MRSLSLSCLAFIAGFCAFACSASQPAKEVKTDRPPNVVILYADDVGYGDVGVYGATKIPTPRIDALAAQSLRFTDGHCAASTCTPSRYSLLTGEMAFRQPGKGIAHALSNMLIKPDRFTMADLFKNAGYTTGYVGKWHLGLDDEPINWNTKIDPGVQSLGFDHHFIMPATNDRLPAVYIKDGRVVNLDPDDPITIQRGRRIADDVPGTTYPDARQNPEAITAYPGDPAHSGTVINGLGRIGFMKGGQAALWKDEDLADDFVREAGMFIKANRDKPFFLLFSANDIHAPRWPHERFRGVSDHGLRGDAMVSLDWSCGAILDMLDEHGLAENTLVIFASDNGPVSIDGGYLDGSEINTIDKPSDRGHFAAGPYRGGKYTIYEGGTRTPFIVRWPGKVEPGVSSALISQTDLLASFAALLDQPIPEGQAPDSRNHLPAFLGKDADGAEIILVQTNNTQAALRSKHWKYIPGNDETEAQLYDLSADIGEKNNLIHDRPQVAQKLAAVMQRYSEQGLAER